MSKIDCITTPGGLRLLQHGTILSELMRHPGPTDTTADILAALVTALRVASPLALLGFAGGAVVAPLRALGCHHVIEAVDLDRTGHVLFRKICASYAGEVQFHQGDAAAWLETREKSYSMILEDLSIPQDNDVTIPPTVWTTLPELIHSRLQERGVAVFNLLLPPTKSWPGLLRDVIAPFAQVVQLRFTDFENRIIVASQHLPPTRQLAARLRSELGRLGSSLGSRISLGRMKRSGG